MSALPSPEIPIVTAPPHDHHEQSPPRGTQHGGRQMMHGSYKRFGAMILTSTAIMWVLMYSLVYEWAHVRFADTRFFMALFMGAVMTIVMLAFMLNMYQDRRKNAAIFAGAAAVFVVFLYLARSQHTVGDVAYMKAMIPHHSIAILTSRRAQIRDPRVRQLADEIIAAQVREIREMDLLIDDIQRSGSRGAAVLPARPAEVTPDMEPKIRESVR